MTLRFWPVRNWTSIIRIAVLLTILGVVAFYGIRISQLDFGPVVRAGGKFFSARVFEGLLGKPSSNVPKQIELESVYAWCLANEVSISQKAEQFFEDHRSAPISMKDLARYGLSTDDQIDPWKHTYQLHVLKDYVFVVQSTGPSGKDAVAWDRPETLDKLLANRIQMIGDNLLVVEKLTVRPSAESRTVHPSRTSAPVPRRTNE